LSGLRLMDNVVNPLQIILSPSASSASVVVAAGGGCNMSTAQLHQNTLSLDIEYYIEKQILPSLRRVLNLAGLDPQYWYETEGKQKGHQGGFGFADRREVRRTVGTQAILASLGHVVGAEYPVVQGVASRAGCGGEKPRPQQRTTQTLMTQYLRQQMCDLCGQASYDTDGVCETCAPSSLVKLKNGKTGTVRSATAMATVVAHVRLAEAQKRAKAAQQICHRCLGLDGSDPWQSAIVPYGPLPASACAAGSSPPPPSPLPPPPPLGMSSSTTAAAATTVATSSSSSDRRSRIVAGGRPMSAAACVSLDCPVLYERYSAQRDLGGVLDLLKKVQAEQDISGPEPAEPRDDGNLGGDTWMR
jgi:hypothetical protein